MKNNELPTNARDPVSVASASALPSCSGVPKFRYCDCVWPRALFYGFFFFFCEVLRNFNIINSIELILIVRTVLGDFF